ncbi:MAG: hypothetical protein JO336_07000 [Acidobacteriia bacterium]|nr:hypothetical protein [Terriglobia bacterium]MBV8906300.1 hypothetical protein [Terriglobia bacterium]
MKLRRLLSCGAALAGLCALWIRARAAQLPLEPAHDSGQSVTGAYEGWFKNPDGSFSFLLGYYNRNLKQPLDIPVGPNNRIEPGGPDRGQPTHFLPNRQWGIFTVSVPKDFGDQKLTWTINVNGMPTVIPMSLNPLWEVSPFVDATGNTPPFIGFSEKGPLSQGPRPITASLKIAVATPLPLTVWVADDAKQPPITPRFKLPPVSLTWSKFRGPGEVTFSKDRPAADPTEFSAPPNTVFHGKATTSATFSQPGEYILSVVANDSSGPGGGGFQCCWTNAQVNVSVAANTTP